MGKQDARLARVKICNDAMYCMYVVKRDSDSGTRDSPIWAIISHKQHEELTRKRGSRSLCSLVLSTMTTNLIYLFTNT
jgi:hypothetical protein